MVVWVILGNTKPDWLFNVWLQFWSRPPEGAVSLELAFWISREDSTIKNPTWTKMPIFSPESLLILSSCLMVLIRALTTSKRIIKCDYIHFALLKKLSSSFTPFLLITVHLNGGSIFLFTEQRFYRLGINAPTCFKHVLCFTGVCHCRCLKKNVIPFRLTTIWQNHITVASRNCTGFYYLSGQCKLSTVLWSNSLLLNRWTITVSSLNARPS